MHLISIHVVIKTEGYFDDKRAGAMPHEEYNTSLQGCRNDVMTIAATHREITSPDIWSHFRNYKIDYFRYVCHLIRVLHIDLM